MSNQDNNYNIDFDEIRELVENYKQKKELGQFRGYKEEASKNNFITPLFRALGWNTENKVNRNDSVSYEENISGKRSDYGFSINGIAKFYLEAKSLKEEEILFGTDYDKQAVNYAWLKTCSWAVLTNFETLAVYNADSAEPVWAFTLKAEEYLSENGREKLKLLSKKGFEENLLDKWAEDNGKKPMKRLVDKQLLQDMIQFREILSKDIKKNNPNISEPDLDETVQRTLDRLVFIRNAEDREYEPKELSSNYRQWSLKENGHLVRKIRELYQHYRVIYNSGLFGKKEDEIHISDQVEISNDALAKVIQGLYSPEGAKYSYNFANLEKDVLGKIYEQYLGNILKSTPKRAKLEESKTHRKEQGIYYTPSYIVDYIVRNAVGEYIRTHTPEEIKKVRILDPACGSGSFLIRAYKELENYWNRNSVLAQSSIDSEEFYSKKVEILKNNIFGVDLDSKAVEIAQLNLLLQISERKKVLPTLQNNIKVGNSLIDDTSVTDKAFKWQEEFPEIMKSGGFDIILGNPPYVRSILLREEPTTWNYYKQFYKTAFKEFDIYMCFLEKAYSLLSNNGRLGFIMPNKWLHAGMGESARRLFLENRGIESIVNFGSLQVFDGATNYTMIIFLRKKPNELIKVINYVGPTDTNIVNIDTDQPKLWQKGTVRYDLLSEAPWNLIIDEAQGIFQRLRTQPTFGEYFSLAQGTGTRADAVFFVRKLAEDKENYVIFSNQTNKQYEVKKAFLMPSVKGEDVDSYKIRRNDELLIFPYIGKMLVKSTEIQEKNPELWKYLNECRPALDSRENGRFKGDHFYCYGRPQNHELLPSKKILVPTVVNRAKAAFDRIGLYVIDSVYFVKRNKPSELADEYVLALLNSKLMTYFLMKTSTNLRGGYFSMKPGYLERFPLKAVFTNEDERKYYNSIVEIVKQIEFLTSQSLSERNTEKVQKLKDELDDNIFAIYELSDGEKEIISTSTQ